MVTVAAKFECSLLGHKERTFDVRFSADGSKLLTASQDGTARLFDASTRRCIATLKHSTSTEVLRAAFVGPSLICTGGADGYAKIWPTGVGAPSPLMELAHGPEEQIYVCEQCGPPNSNSLLTASNDSLYVWDLAASIAGACCERRSFGAATAGFGGPRNPDNVAYIFDAKPCATNQAAGLYRTTAVALSDGTVRVVDMRTSRDACVWGASPVCNPSPAPADGPRVPKRARSGSPVAQDMAAAPPVDVTINVFAAGQDDLSGRKAHVTSVCWSPDGLSIVATLGNGDVAVVDTRKGQVRGVFKGCHGSTCYGAAPMIIGGSGGSYPTQYNGYMSWSSDGSVRLWSEQTSAAGPSSFSSSVVLTVPSSDPSSPYPVYAASMRWFSPCNGTDEKLLIAVAGGISGLQFIGSPVHVINLSKSLDTSR